MPKIEIPVEGPKSCHPSVEPGAPFPLAQIASYAGKTLTQRGLDEGDLLSADLRDRLVDLRVPVHDRPC